MSYSRPPTAAAAPSEDDATLARRLQLMEQLTSVFGFDPSIAQQAIDALGVTSDAQTCYNYILDNNLAQDQGGPVTPIETCPHVNDHVKISTSQLPLRPQDAKCTHSPNEGSTAGLAKADVSEDGSCPSTENWLCLECGVVRCSRYVNRHNLLHWQQTQEVDADGHCVAVSLGDLSVWCHKCNSYIRNKVVLDPILKTLEEFKFANENSKDGQNPNPRKFEEPPNAKKPKPMDADEMRAFSSSTLGQMSNAGDSSEADEKQNNGKCGEEQDKRIGLNLNDDENDDEHSEGDDDDDSEDADDLIQLIASAAAAQGIPLDWILDRAGAEEGEEVEQIEYPFGTLPSSLEEVADFIKSDKCRKILVLAGAGMSVSAGIPDFRSADGLYATLNPDLLTANAAEREAIRDDPTVALDQNLFLQNPLPMLELQREFILGTRGQRWKATLAHRFVELLYAKTGGKLVRLYTQNIDGLEMQCTRLPRDKVIAVHGSMDRAECARCKSESDFEAFCDKVQSQIKDLSGQDPKGPSESTPIPCPICGYRAMKPSIVLFKSSLPKVFFESVPKDVKDVDLLIVMGTSLRVAPANSLVWRVPRACMRLLVNREEVGNHLGMHFDEQTATRDYFAEGDTDKILLELMDHLGWLDELEPLLENHKFPESSARLLRSHLAQQKESEADNLEDTAERLEAGQNPKTGNSDESLNPEEATTRAANLESTPMAEE